MDESRPATPSAKSRRGLPPSSVFFLGLSAVLAVLAVLLATGVVRFGSSTPAAPPPTPGRIITIDIVRALQAQGLTAEQQPGSIPRGGFSAPAQVLAVDGEPLYAFVFSDPETAAGEAAAIDPFDVLPASVMPAPDEERLPSPDAAPPMIARGSNVVVAMPGGSDDLRAKVRAAIEGLP